MWLHWFEHRVQFVAYGGKVACQSRQLFCLVSAFASMLDSRSSIVSTSASVLLSIVETRCSITCICFVTLPSVSDSRLCISSCSFLTYACASVRCSPDMFNYFLRLSRMGFIWFSIVAWEIFMSQMANYIVIRHVCNSLIICIIWLLSDCVLQVWNTENSALKCVTNVMIMSLHSFEF